MADGSQVMRGDNVSEKSDVYSFGVVLWEMVTMEQPWTGRRPEQVVFAVGSEEKRLALSDEMQPQVRGLIEDCWNPQPRERPSFLTIIQRLSPLEKVGINSITTSRPVEELEIEN